MSNNTRDNILQACPPQHKPTGCNIYSYGHSNINMLFTLMLNITADFCTKSIQMVCLKYNLLDNIRGVHITSDPGNDHRRADSEPTVALATHAIYLALPALHFVVKQYVC